MAQGKKVKIEQLDFDTSEFIDSYESINDAAYDNYIPDNTLGKKLKQGNGTAKMQRKQLLFRVATI